MRFRGSGVAGSVHAAVLSPEQVDRFHVQGYLVVNDLFPSGAIDELSTLIDPLFEHLDRLPAYAAKDLAPRNPEDPYAALRTPEIVRVLRCEPRLRSTSTFRTCKAAARILTSRRMWYSFDHAISKQPFNDAATPWHQDQVYTGHRTSLNTVHFWIPLQDVDVDNGCMHFIPGSHFLDLQHHTRSLAAPTLSTDVPVNLMRRAVACPVRKGGVTIHTPLTLHFTGPNRTATPRRAWIVHFGPFGRLAKLQPAVLIERLGGAIRGRRQTKHNGQY